MNKKGFTLIELLAVIIILSLLALLTGVSIIGIVKNSKEDLYNTQIELIKAAGSAWGSDNIDKIPEAGECAYITIESLKEYGLLDKSIINPKTNEEFEDIYVKITTTSIIYNSLNIEYEVVSDIGTCYDVYNKPKPYLCKRATILHEEECNSLSERGCLMVGYETGQKIQYGNLGTSGTLSSGDAFDCDVNGDGIYDSETERFYYVSDYYDTKKDIFNNEVATLIYYSNTVGAKPDKTTNISYNADGINDLGPLTVKNNLPTTNEWNNVHLYNSSRNIRSEKNEIIISNFSYEGYAARLLTTQEIAKTCNIEIGTNGNVGVINELKMCNYLLENTVYGSLDVLYGYWLENPYAASSDNEVWSVTGGSVYVDADNAKQSNKGTSEVVRDGARPAIDVLKTNMEI